MRTVLRAKGIVHLADDPARAYTLQKVGRRHELMATGPWLNAPASRLVMIGPRGEMDGEAITRSLEQCLERQSAES